MIAADVASVIVGTTLVCSVLLSAVETVVLPRNGFTRICRCVFAVAHRMLIHRWRNKVRQATLRDLYAPIALVTLPLVWMLTVTIGFTFIFWGIRTGSWSHSLEVSGSSLFTLGFSEPDGTSRIWLTFVEATIGLGLVALLISYLPTIYSAHHEREKGISLMRPFAGSPANSVEMLGNLHRLGFLGRPDLWKTAASWLLELDQTHTAFPALCYFPESTPNQSWVASVGAVLDGAALVISTSDFSTEERAIEQVTGPMLLLAYGIPGLVRIGTAAGLPLEPPARLMRLLASATDEPPRISVQREEYLAAVQQLSALLTVSEGELEACWRRFAWIRSGYDRSLCGLAGFTDSPPALWSTDRPASVGRPRLIRAQHVDVRWNEDQPPRVATSDASNLDR